MTRDEEITDFLGKSGWKGARRVPLAADASLRVYDRVMLDGRTGVLMNVLPVRNAERFLPQQLVLVREFVIVDGLLRDIGIRAPEIYAKDIDAGLMLLEDFGDNSFTRLLDAGRDARALYRLATDAAIHIKRNLRLPDNMIVTHDPRLMRADMQHLLDWVIPYVSQTALSAEALAEYDALAVDLIARIQKMPKGLALYDYHVDNLMLTPDGACGVLDFQDVRLTGATYDIMSLLNDERRDVPEDVRAEMLARYYAAFPELDTPEIRALSNLLILERHIKVVGQFTRFYVNDKRDKYLKYLPLIWTKIERRLEAPECRPLKKWLDAHVPQSVRYLEPDALIKHIKGAP
ncbi:MAG: phosphotransferase [Alphaproteobacteria bacterium]|nr:phosphotransferase [Alphaproteobacteria bacterium]